MQILIISILCLQHKESQFSEDEQDALIYFSCLYPFSIENVKRRENCVGNSILASSIAPFAFLPNLILLVLNGFLKPNRCFGHKEKKSQKKKTVQLLNV